jgi:flagellar secretion chaperone FliS
MFSTASLTSAKARAPGQRMAGLYTDVGVQGAAGADGSGHALIGMLYEGALGAIARARGALASGDVDAKNRAVAKAVAIVGEGLRASLNLEQGGALAANLNQLYGYVELRLTQANLRNDDTAFAECAELLRPLYEAWQQIAAQVRAPR